jgi:nitric oxide reductase large subunit
VVFTGTDIQKGQEVFLKYGLMEHGSLWGHGAYLGLCVFRSERIKSLFCFVCYFFKIMPKRAIWRVWVVS